MPCPGLDASSHGSPTECQLFISSKAESITLQKLNLVLNSERAAAEQRDLTDLQGFHLAWLAVSTSGVVAPRPGSGLQVGVLQLLRDSDLSKQSAGEPLPKDIVIHLLEV